jgi:hypothetical protein
VDGVLKMLVDEAILDNLKAIYARQGNYSKAPDAEEKISEQLANLKKRAAQVH